MSTPRSVLRRLRIRLLPVPSQALGLAVLVAVLAAALVSAPLMVASAEQAAWHQEFDRVGQNGLGLRFDSSTLAGRQESAAARIARIGELDDAVLAAAADAGLDRPMSLAVLHRPILTAPPHAPAAVQLVYGTDSADAVEIVAGAAHRHRCPGAGEAGRAGRRRPRRRADRAGRARRTACPCRSAAST